MDADARPASSHGPTESEAGSGLPCRGGQPGASAAPTVRGDRGRVAGGSRHGRARTQTRVDPYPPSGQERRSKTTNPYLPRHTLVRLVAATTETGMSTIDLILQAVHAQWPRVRSEMTNRCLDEGSLDLPLPRRARRSVPDAATVQVRLSAAEHAGLSTLARSLQASVSGSRFRVRGLPLAGVRPDPQRRLAATREGLWSAAPRTLPGP
jgi:hypothetical protein